MKTKDWKTYRDVPCDKILRQKVQRLTPVPCNSVNGDIDSRDFIGVRFDDLKDIIKSGNYENPIIAAYGSFTWDAYIEGICIIHDTWETDDELSNRRIEYQKKQFKALKTAETRLKNKQEKIDKEFLEYQRLKAKFEND